MGEFCKGCSEELFGFDAEDFKGLVKAGEYAKVICEGCFGIILVDHNGQRVSARAELYKIVS